MLKNDIRKQYKKLRNDILDNEKSKLEDLILIQFQKLALPNCTNLLSYLPIIKHNEFNPILLEDYFLLINENAQLHFPIVNETTNTMSAVLVNEHTDFEQKAFDIYEPINCPIVEPSNIDLILVPLLAFDTNGYRVGYGKGFYDNFIKQCKPNVIKIGISFFEPVVIDDVNEWDHTLTYCITPQKIYQF
jgi:5-formyltetrahydrofolate cyclo-ligase